MIPIIIEFIATSLQPVFFRLDESIFPVRDVVKCYKYSNQLNFVDSEKDWRDANKQAASHGNRLCSTGEI